MVMESLVSDHHREGHFHEASEHGLAWVALQETLHLIVLLYTLFGMIRFRVKFIHAVKLVRRVSYILIFFNCYLIVKFFSVGALMYAFNESIERSKLSLADYNCSLANHAIVWARRPTSGLGNSSGGGTVPRSDLDKSNKSQNAPDSLTSQQEFMATLAALFDAPVELLLKQSYPHLFAHWLHLLGGPLKLTGNPATLMYGFLSISLYITVGIFPLELMYYHVGFNFIRFTLSDPTCMRDLYKNRQRLLERLASWSRHESDSELSKGVRGVIGQRNQRVRHVGHCGRPQRRLLHSEAQIILQQVAQGAAARQGRAPAGGRAAKLAPSKRDKSLAKSVASGSASATRVKPLRSRLNINHRDWPYSQVIVANRNLKRFKPYVRSEHWFKSSMVIYTLFVSYYFTVSTLLTGGIFIYLTWSLAAVGEVCSRRANRPVDLWNNWTLLDSMLYVETQYSVFAISCASSFYCSYYFGTVLELYVWKSELLQQLRICRNILELRHRSQGSLSFLAPTESLREETSARIESMLAVVLAANSWRVRHNRRMRARAHSGVHTRRGDGSIGPLSFDAKLESVAAENVTEFAGLKTCWAHLRLLKSLSQTRRNQVLEVAAVKLLLKKQTVLRATCVNFDLFLEEIKETHFMMNITLKRTAQLVFGFALTASLTRSQFKANYWHLTFLLAACLFLLNLYLACAALINSGVSGMGPKFNPILSFN